MKVWIVAIGCVLVLGYFGLDGSRQQDYIEPFGEALRSGSVVKLSDHTDFDWDTVHIFNNKNSSTFEVSRQLGYPWLGWMFVTKGGMREFVTWVYTNEGRVVAYTSLQATNTLDYLNIDGLPMPPGFHNTLAVSDAVFKLRELKWYNDLNQLLTKQSIYPVNLKDPTPVQVAYRSCIDGDQSPFVDGCWEKAIKARQELTAVN